MSFFNKRTKKRQQPKIPDDFQVVFNTSENLSEKQKNAIITIIKDGIAGGEDLYDIVILISMCMKLPNVGIRYKDKNSIEVII